MSTPTSYTPLTLTGNSTSSGTLNPTELQISPLSVSGNSTSSGTITLTTSSVAGAIADFAVTPWLTSGAGYADPALTHVTGTIIRNAPSDPVNQWVRLSVTASAPRTYPAQGGTLYNRAAYAGIRVISDAMPTNSTQQIAYAQLEKTPPGGSYDINVDRPGINLLDIEQSSYEGRVFYTPDFSAIPVGATYTRTNETASCGLYSGMYVYNTPPTNTYQTVQYWGTYRIAATQRATYADLAYNAPPGAPAAAGSGYSTFAVLPIPQAYTSVSSGTTVVTSIAIAGPTNAQGAVRLYEYDSSYNLIRTTTGPATTLLGTGTFTTLRFHTVLGSTTVWAAVAPVVTTATAVNTMTFFADEHRIYVPSALAQSAPGTTPARPWQPPKQLIIKLRATRLNYCQNPGFYNSAWGYYTRMPLSVSATFTRNLTGGFNGGACGDLLIPSLPTAALTGSGAPTWCGVGTDAFQGVAITGIPANTWVTLSAYVRPVQGPVPVTIWAHNGDYLVRGTSTPMLTGTAPYTRLSVTMLTNEIYGGTTVLNFGYAASDLGALFPPSGGVPPAANPTVWSVTTSAATRGAWSATTGYSAGDIVTYTDGLNYQAAVQNGTWASVGPLEFYVDNVLVETSRQLMPYFDGNSPSLDYMWEPVPAGTAVGDTRSHYYRGKTVTQYRLDTAVQRSLPLGAQYQLVYTPAP
ncbi:hypothetical protein ACIGXM_14235 [Kitasatospora sp. NPDC052896]|uniref:hypothetical protein n=1 Tax=Kitasatospora sp. NPDC052896 TaxID=3364061 RepID=UPI0037C7033E